MEIKGNFLSIILILVFSTSLLFTGCHQEREETNKVDIPFSEKQIKMPPNINYISDLCIMEDGTLKAICVDRTNHFVSQWDYNLENNNWSKVTDYTDKLNVTLTNKTELIGYLSPDGKVEITVTKWTDEMGKNSASQYFLFDKTNDPVEILKADNNTEESKPDEMEFHPICFSRSGEIVPISMLDNVYRSDINYSCGEELFAELKPPLIYTVFNDSFIGLGYGKYESVDLLSNELIDDPTLEYMAKDAENEFIKGQNEIAVIRSKSNENIYFYLNNKGIWQYEQKGDMVQKSKLVDGNNTILGIQDNFFDKLMAYDDSNLFLTGENSNGPFLLKYTKEDQKPKETRNIVAFSLYDTDAIRQLINAFNREQNEINVIYKYGITDDEITIEDAINKLNTNILAGEGPDILFLDNMKPESYIDKSLLGNISSILDNNNMVLPNPVSSKSGDEILYAIPCGFSLMSISGDKVVLDNSDSINDLITNMEKNDKEFPAESFNDNVVLLYLAYIEPLSSNSISKDVIADFYKSLDDIRAMTNRADKEDVYFSANSLNINSVQNYRHSANDKSIIGLDYISSVSDLTEINYFMNKKELTYKYLADKNDEYYIPRTIVSMNNNSKNKKDSLSFIKYSINEGGQKSISTINQLPVNKSVLSDKLEAQGKIQMYDATLDKTHNIPPFSNSDRKKFIKYIDKRFKSTNNDGIVMEIIFKNAQAYLNGEISIENATESTMQKLSVYNDEQ